MSECAGDVEPNWHHEGDFRRENGKPKMGKRRKKLWETGMKPSDSSVERRTRLRTRFEFGQSGFFGG
jgi:hypothetical protein